MPFRKAYQRSPIFRCVPQWLLIVLVMVVLSLMILAFIVPSTNGVEEETADPAAISPTSEAISNDESHALEDAPQAVPTAPEEIGYTDGIILWSTILVLILLVGTLRETWLQKKGRNCL